MHFVIFMPKSQGGSLLAHYERSITNKTLTLAWDLEQKNH